MASNDGDGAAQLAAWIDAVPVGATVLPASCSRLAWAHSRTQLPAPLGSYAARVHRYVCCVCPSRVGAVV